jgi:hypothetical protein
MEGQLKGAIVARVFVLAFIKFVGLVFPAAFMIAFLAEAAQPAPIEQPSCERNLADVTANMTALQARLKRLGKARTADACNANRLYFLEVVKARAATASCKTGPQRDRELARLDADVENINHAIAARCG